MTAPSEPTSDARRRCGDRRVTGGCARPADHSGGCVAPSAYDPASWPQDSSPQIETMNDQVVGVQGRRVLVQVPKVVMTPEQAIRHAAWLVAVAQCLDPAHSFDEVFRAVASA